jgi:hypothetical protein
VIDVLLPNDIAQMMASGSRKKQRSQKLPGKARIQKTRGLCFQLSTMQPPRPGVRDQAA